MHAPGVRWVLHDGRGVLGRCDGTDDAWIHATAEYLQSLARAFCGQIRPCPRMPQMTQSSGAPPPGLIFHSRFEPAIALHEYLLSLATSKDIQTPHVTVLYAIELIRRIQQKDADFHLCQRNAHRMVLVAMLIATKVLHDDTYDNAHWARIGGVSLGHLNELEIEFLTRIEYSLFCHSLRDAHATWLQRAFPTDDDGGDPCPMLL